MRHSTETPLAMPEKGGRWTARLRMLVPALAVVGLVLFPFDWLSDVWPGYAQVFDRVFVTARDHAIGHAALFAIAGALAVVTLPGLRARPARYFGLVLAGALAEELIQALARRHLPNPGDARDLLFDLAGATIAYAALRAVSGVAERVVLRRD